MAAVIPASCRAAHLNSERTLLNLPGALTRLWNEVQAALKLQATRVEFNTWIQRAVLHSVEGGVATIAVPNALVKDGVEGRFLPQLRDLLTMHTGEPIEVRAILNGAPQEGDAAAVPDRDPTPASRSTQPHPLPEPAADPALRPDWIGAGQWVSLSAMLRAALIGSSLIDGQVVAASPYLSRLLRIRYARELAELVADPRLLSSIALPGDVRDAEAHKEDDIIFSA